MKTTVINSELTEYFEQLADAGMIGECDLAIGAVNDTGRACGILLGRQEMDVFRITYIYVNVDSRRQGAAAGMYSLLRNICTRSGLNGICSDICGGGDTGLSEFYKSAGFIQYEQTNPIYMFDLKAINSKMLEKKIPLSDSIVEKLGNVLDRDFAIMRNERNLSRNNNMNEVIPAIGQKKVYSQSVSQVLLHKNIPVGCILVSKDGGDYCIDYLYVGRAGNSALAVMAMISEAFRNAVAESENANIYVNAANSSVTGILEKLTGNQARICGDSTMYYQYL